MPISPVGRTTSRAATAGFTLVELLVVVSVIAILAVAGTATLGLRGPGSAGPDALAAAFQRDIARARDSAVLGRRSAGLRLRADGWQAVARVAGGWQAQGAPVVARGVALTWEIAGTPVRPALVPADDSTAPEIVLRPDGGGEALLLVLRGAGGERRCAGDGWGVPACD